MGKGLAFAYIPAMCDIPGTEIQVEVMGELRNAKVLEGPPVLTQPMRDSRKVESPRAPEKMQEMKQ